MAKYIYQGPVSGVTLTKRVQGKKKAERVEIMLHPGKSPRDKSGADIELDPDHPYTKRLIARGHLREVAVASPEPSKASPTAGSEDTSVRSKGRSGK